MISTDGSITDYVCAYGNNGRNQEQRGKILLDWAFRYTMHIWRLIVVGAIGLCLARAQLIVLYQKRLINSGFYDFAIVYQFVHIN